MIVGFDVDDMILDTATFLLRHVNLLYGTSFRKEDIETNIESLFGERKDEVERELHRLMESRADEILPLEGAVETILRVAEKHMTIAVTRRARMDEITRLSLKTHCGDAIEEVYFAGLNGNRRPKKSEVLSRVKVYRYFDDDPRIAYDCAKVGIKVGLFNQPWNQKFIQHENIAKIYGWNRVEDFLK